MSISEFFVDYQSGTNEMPNKVVAQVIKAGKTYKIKGFLGANQFANTFNPVQSNSWFGFSNISLVVKLPILIGEHRNGIHQQFKMEEIQLGMQAIDKQEQFAQETAIANLKTNNLETQVKTLKENLLLSQESLLIIQQRVEEGQETASYYATLKN